MNEKNYIKSKGTYLLRVRTENTFTKTVGVVDVEVHNPFCSELQVLEKAEDPAYGVVRVFNDCSDILKELKEPNISKKIIRNGKIIQYSKHELERDIRNAEATLELLKRHYHFRLTKEGLI